MDTSFEAHLTDWIRSVERVLRVQSGNRPPPQVCGVVFNWLASSKFAVAYVAVKMMGVLELLSELAIVFSIYDIPPSGVIGWLLGNQNTKTASWVGKEIGKSSWDYLRFLQAFPGEVVCDVTTTDHHGWSEGEVGVERNRFACSAGYNIDLEALYNAIRYDKK